MAGRRRPGPRAPAHHALEVTMTISKIHHINFIVEDIDAAIATYTTLLGEDAFVKDELQARGVVTARARIGEQWLVLVQPIERDSIPGRYLQEHGEGFFLMSLEVGDMARAVEELAEQGMDTTSDEDRKGLLDWWVRDLDMSRTHGAQLQLCEERESTG